MITGNKSIAIPSEGSALEKDPFYINFLANCIGDSNRTKEPHYQDQKTS